MAHRLFYASPRKQTSQPSFQIYIVTTAGQTEGINGKGLEEV